ncbi:glutamate carboxypeptidase [Burkholderiaceae bacterium UC74_6]
MRLQFLVVILACTAAHAGPDAGPDAALLAAARAEQPLLLERLAKFCAIESGSHDAANLARMADALEEPLRQLGAEVERIAPTEIDRMEDTPATPGAAIKATFKGRGKRSVLLLAHMDTVYAAGNAARQPFAVIGDRAYGLGILDDKQGLALVLSTLKLLKDRGFDDYARITVLFNGDEEISSPASRRLIAELGATHDAVLSFEGAGRESISLATSGILAVHLDVRGRAAHAGAPAGAGVNALEELAHQILQTRKLFDGDEGLNLNWTLARAGEVRNMIPPEASALADVRLTRPGDAERVQTRLRDAVLDQLLPEARISLRFENRRPPMAATPASRALAARAVNIAAELGLKLSVQDQPLGGGTDAAFAALNARGPVIENLGLRGAGAHAAQGQQAEYILVSSIVPRLYLALRLVEDVLRHGDANGVR